MTGERAGPCRVEVLADAEELARWAADEIVAILGEALARRQRATWVLAGGSTPRRLYQELAGRPAALDWRRVELFWGDERGVEPSSRHSNFGLARDTLLSALPLAEGRVHRIRGELAPAAAARRYAREIEAALTRGPFDLVLLGLGEDGHVASIFPGARLPAGDLAVAVESPAEPRWRVTLTPPALARCRRQVYLVQGRGKSPAVARALDPERTEDLVSERVRPPAGLTVWLLDRAAAAELPDTSGRPCGSLTSP